MPEPQFLLMLLIVTTLVLGLLVAWLLYRHDLTRRRDLLALQEKVARLSKALNVAGIGFLEWNLKTDEIELSDEVLRIYGFGPEQKWAGTDLPAKTVHPEDREAVQKFLLSARDGAKGATLDHRVVRADGEVIWVQAQAELVRDAAGNPKTLLGTLIDITERKRVEEALRRNETLLAQAGQVARVAGWEFDPGTDQVTWTKEAYRLHQIPQGTTLSLADTIKLFHPDDRSRLEAAVQSAMEKGEQYDLELRLRTVGGDELWIRTMGQPRIVDGKTVKLTGTFLDITVARKSDQEIREHRDELEKVVEKRTEQLHLRVSEVEQLNSALLNLADDLRAANAELKTSTQRLTDGNRELKDFTYSVSHDLRAPLRAISGFAEIITRRHRSDLNEEGQKYLGHIVTAAGNMGHLIDDLLRFARLGSGALELRPVPLQGLLSRVVGDLAGHQAEVGGVIEAPDDLPVVWGDETLMGQIFTNLLDNALTYHRPGFPPQVVVKWREESGSVVLSVSDKGIGISAKDHEKIFNIFQRLHSHAEYSGTGIGLAIVKKASALLAGQVWVESSKGEGSTFHVRIPRGAEEKDCRR